MKTSTNGRALIESFEGLILGAYDDANDKIVRPGQSVKGTLTIGYGHTTSAGPPRVVVGQKITKEQADSILASDLAGVEADVNRLVKVSINQNQYDALVSFHFNTGGLGRSSVLSRLNNKDFKGAADGLLLWNRAGGKVLQGLVTRRKKERELFLTPSTMPVRATGTAVGALTIAGGTPVALGYFPHLWPWFLGAGVVLVGILAYFIRKHKHNVQTKT